MVILSPNTEVAVLSVAFTEGNYICYASHLARPTVIHTLNLHTLSLTVKGILQSISLYSPVDQGH